MARQKLRVETKAEELIAEVERLLRKVAYQCNACGHLEKSANAVLFNLGEGIDCYKPRKKASKYDIARGEAGEVRRAARALVLKRKLTEPEIAIADDLADCIIGMLTNMIKNLEERG